jgi:lactoylglutathione lyase
MQNLMTIVMVSDMNASVQFYQHTLGLPLRFQTPEWTEFDFGPSTLALHGGGKQSPPSMSREPLAGTANIGFTVDDLDATVASLKGKGVRFVMEPTLREKEGIRLAVGLDPDGLAISFAQVVAHGQPR